MGLTKVHIFAHFRWDGWHTAGVNMGLALVVSWNGSELSTTCLQIVKKSSIFQIPAQSWYSQIITCEQIVTNALACVQIHAACLRLLISRLFWCIYASTAAWLVEKWLILSVCVKETFPYIPPKEIMLECPSLLCQHMSGPYTNLYDTRAFYARNVCFFNVDAYQEHRDLTAGFSTQTSPKNGWDSRWCKNVKQKAKTCVWRDGTSSHGGDCG